MHRSYQPTFCLDNCIITQNRQPLIFVPKQCTTYFINSKRRFFLYFKYRDQMQQVIKIFEKENVKFHQRKSMFPDRQQQQQIVFHCNYKYKKKDLRWVLSRDTKLRQPRNRFYEPKDNNFAKQFSKDYRQEPIQNEANKTFSGSQQKISSKKSIQLKHLQMQVQETQPQYVADFGQIKIKNPQVLNIINNIQLIKALFKSEKKK